MFGSNSLKVSVLCGIDFEKGFYYSLIWKELSENVSIALIYTLEKCVVLFANSSVKMSLLPDVGKSV